MWERPMLTSQVCEDHSLPWERPPERQHGVKEVGVGGLPQCHGGLKHETLQQWVEVRAGPGRGTTHGKFWYKSTFFPSPFTMLMFPSELAADDVCCVYWQRVFLKLLNELQCPSLLQKRVYVRVWCVCDGCVWAVVEGVVMCMLLLMSHDFPVFSTLQNVPILAREMSNECFFSSSSVWKLMVRICQQSKFISPAEAKFNF